MKVTCAALAILLAVPALAAPQEVDGASDLTGYRRFLVYPHLQKGWDAMQRGDRDLAVSELEHAHRLAPDSVTVALHLAAAYRKFGETGRAETVLREQLSRTPDDPRLRAALAEYQSARAPAPATVAKACSDAMPPSCRDTSTRADQPAVESARAKPQSKNAFETGANMTKPPSDRPGPRRQQPSKSVAAPDTMNELRAAFTVALQSGRFDSAERHADLMLAQNPGGASLFDEVTYKLVDAGASEQATRILLRAYPFAGAGPGDRDRLLQRLGLLIEQQRDVLPVERFAQLRDPLETPALRSRQAALLASLDDCGGVRGVLADLSPEYGYDDWMRLGDCSTMDDPLLAEQAYARAHTLQPGGRGSRAVAYAAYATGDYRTALDAWRTVRADHLQGDHLIAAATTAIAAGEHDQATAWLTRYRDSGNPLNHPYWSLLGQSYGDNNPAAALGALERAVELRPNVDVYLRLARIDQAPARQVYWLEHAARIDGHNGRVQLQLAYAYTRAGRSDSALSALERAAALDPDDIRVQVELGFAQWRAGHAALARRSLERAWRADPTNVVLAQQLVYVAQRLKQNEVARGFARQVLDATPASDAAASEESAVAAERRFGFQRLHEDLGRRVTVSLDGFSGTRVGTATSTRQADGGYRSYSQLEADVRLGSPAIRDGTTLSAYARVFGDGGEQRSVLPSENAMVGVGVRWKPMRSQIFYLAAENQTGLEDHSRKDVLLRASASFFNGGRHSDDWHPARGWVSRNLYLDGAHYLKSDYRALTADYRMSYHRRISTKQTLEPYGHLQFIGLRDQRFNRDLRGGVGVRWNVWYGGTKYDADPHKLSVGVEFQQVVETYLPDRNGVFVTFGTRW